MKIDKVGDLIKFLEKFPLDAEFYFGDITANDIGSGDFNMYVDGKKVAKYSICVDSLMWDDVGFTACDGE